MHIISRACINQKLCLLKHCRCFHNSHVLLLLFKELKRFLSLLSAFPLRCSDVHFKKLVKLSGFISNNTRNMLEMVSTTDMIYVLSKISWIHEEIKRTKLLEL